MVMNGILSLQHVQVVLLVTSLMVLVVLHALPTLIQGTMLAVV